MPVNPNPDPNPYPIQAMPDWRRFFVVFFFCAATGDGVSLELALNDNDGDVAVSAVSAVVREYPNLASVLRAALLLPHSDGRYVEEHERLYDMYYSSVL